MCSVCCVVKLKYFTDLMSLKKYSETGKRMRIPRKHRVSSGYDPTSFNSLKTIVFLKIKIKYYVRILVLWITWAPSLLNVRSSLFDYHTSLSAGYMSREDRCAKADFKAESSAAAVEVFVKECMASSDCSADNCKSIYPSVKTTKCKIDCCTGDLCNGAQVPMVSAIMLLACAIVAFAR